MGIFAISIFYFPNLPYCIIIMSFYTKPMGLSVHFPIPSPGDLPVSPPFDDNNRERTVIRTFILDSITPGIYFQSSILIEFDSGKFVPLPFSHGPAHVLELPDQMDMADRL